jgi:hypothetical protein
MSLIKLNLAIAFTELFTFTIHILIVTIFYFLLRRKIWCSRSREWWSIIWLRIYRMSSWTLFNIWLQVLLILRLQLLLVILMNQLVLVIDLCVTSICKTRWVILFVNVFILMQFITRINNKFNSFTACKLVLP